MSKQSKYQPYSPTTAAGDSYISQEKRPKDRADFYTHATRAIMRDVSTQPPAAVFQDMLDLLSMQYREVCHVERYSSNPILRRQEVGRASETIMFCLGLAARRAGLLSTFLLPEGPEADNANRQARDGLVIDLSRPTDHWWVQIKTNTESKATQRHRYDPAIHLIGVKQLFEVTDMYPYSHFMHKAHRQLTDPNISSPLWNYAVAIQSITSNRPSNSNL